MTTQIKKTAANDKGFSLVELVIVIAIMAVLIAILAPQFMRYVELSRIGSDKAALDSYVNAATIYSTQHAGKEFEIHINSDGTSNSIKVEKFTGEIGYDEGDLLHAITAASGLPGDDAGYAVHAGAGAKTGAASNIFKSASGRDNSLDITIGYDISANGDVTVQNVPGEWEEQGPLPYSWST